MKLHLKGFLLIELSKRANAWDYELIKEVNAYYGPSVMNNIRIALHEMAAAGLIYSLEEKLDSGDIIAPGKVLFRYRITDFGRKRMRDTALATV